MGVVASFDEYFENEIKRWTMAAQMCQNGRIESLTCLTSKCSCDLRRV